MNTKSVNGVLFAAMVKSGAASLKNKAKEVNDLNVFPIPDGDTGDNMFMTIDAGVVALADEPAAVGEAARLAANGMLLGARGNSGVILSRIFAGIARGLEGVEEADLRVFHEAMESGVKESYNAVSVPVEGTILTVYRDAVSYAGKRITGVSTLETYFEDLHYELCRSLERTPDLLDVLKEAGVVDSGGAGFVYIAEGMARALTGEITEAIENAGKRKNVDLNAFTEDSVLEFGYCTEFLLRLQRAKVDVEGFDIAPLIEWLNSVGDSVVCFKEGSIVKVHVHTRKPGDVFNHVQQYGEFLTMKVENMTLQHNEAHGGESFKSRVEKPRKPYGIVSVAAGKGIRDAFLSLGCDEVVDGGQSMNPSAEDMISAFQNINADVIFVFPNNSNIIMTAKQAAEMYDGADVRVVPSKTIGDGYAAISMLDTEIGDADAIVASLEEIIAGVVTGTVSRAVRDTEMDGVSVKKDDYIGFVGDTIFVDAPQRLDAALGLAEKMNPKRYDIMLVCCGEDVSAEESEQLFRELKKAYRRTEVVMIDGGQPIYDYIIILE
ncbi:MAG: DAK2 domain-containing protein [Ruminococcus sp.]|nr:DAK2 domain-containing protein [Ruminococcus sp.]